MDYIGNAFSLNMIGNGTEVVLRVTAQDKSDIPEDALSCIGHEATAKVVSRLLGREVPMNRVALSLGAGDELFVAALYEKDGRPFRAPEGRVLNEEELAELRIEFKRIQVLGPQNRGYTEGCVLCGQHSDT